MFKKLIFFVIFSSFFALETFAQNPSAILDLESTSEGFLPPRMNESPRDSIDMPSDGMIIFNTSRGLINYYDEFTSQWKVLTPNTNGGEVDTAQALTLSSAAFRSNRSSASFESNIGDGGATILSAPGGTRLSACIHLLVGSVITGITYYYKDNDAAAEMEISIMKEDLLAPSATNFGSYQTGVSTASNTWVSLYEPLNVTVASNSGYFVTAYSTSWSGNLRIKGAHIEYTLPTN